MIESFKHPPTVAFLSRLTKGEGLKNPLILQKAIRLWVMLLSIYGEEATNTIYCHLRNSFTFVEWRNKFFTDLKPFHNQADNKSLDHQNPDCPCQKTITDWLFSGDFGCDRAQWIEDFSQIYTSSEEQIAAFLETGHWGVGEEKATSCVRVFACTGKTFKNNLQNLWDLDYLDYDSQTRKYQKKTAHPSLVCYL